MTKHKFQSMKIGIVGLGLIGGSIARALKAKAGIRSIEAVDTDEASLKKAFCDSVISGFSMNLKDLQHCDLIYICVPVGITASVLDELSQWYLGIVTDVASTKERIVSYVASQYPLMRFIGGHPMAGSEKVGYSASHENLFENAPYILCPVPSRVSEKPYEQDFHVVRELSILMSAVPVEMSPNEHDAAVGLISHLPHVVAYSLVDLVRSRNDERLKAIAAGGFRDITRIASSDPSLWADILCDSGDKVAELLENYIATLSRMKRMLESHDKDTLLAAFSGAKEYRDQLSMTKHSGSVLVQLWVEVDDKPGMIGRIAVLFGDRGINIKNMNIQDNRAYEGGSLRITLSSSEDARLGAELLQKENLTVRIIE